MKVIDFLKRADKTEKRSETERRERRVLQMARYLFCAYNVDGRDKYQMGGISQGRTAEDSGYNEQNQGLSE